MICLKDYIYIFSQNNINNGHIGHLYLFTLLAWNFQFHFFNFLKKLVAHFSHTCIGFINRYEKFNRVLYYIFYHQIVQGFGWYMKVSCCIYIKFSFTYFNYWYYLILLCLVLCISFNHIFVWSNIVCWGLFLTCL